MACSVCVDSGGAKAPPTKPSSPKVAWRRAFLGLWRRLIAALGVWGNRPNEDSDDAFKFFNGSNNTVKTTMLDEDSEEEVFTEERVVCFSERRCSTFDQRSHVNAPHLRDIYSLIDTILAEQYGESARHCVSHTTATARSTRSPIPSSPSPGSVASSSLYTPLFIFDDASVDTFNRRKDRTTNRAAEPLPKQCRRTVRSSSTHGILVCTEVECPWDTNWAELTLRSDESVGTALSLNGCGGGGDSRYHGHSADTAWPLPSMHTTTHRPNPNPTDESYSSRLYVAWRPKCHLLEV
jgi:hypothetical protein